MKGNISNASGSSNPKDEGINALLSIAKNAQKENTEAKENTLKENEETFADAEYSANNFSNKFTLQNILGGDILFTETIRRQVGLFALITLFILVYIANRYDCDQKILKIDALNKELKDAKYKALHSTSMLTEKSRESNVLDMLKNTNDSIIKRASQPPYIITIPEE